MWNPLFWPTPGFQQWPSIFPWLSFLIELTRSQRSRPGPEQTPNQVDETLLELEGQKLPVPTGVAHWRNVHLVLLASSPRCGKDLLRRRLRLGKQRREGLPAAWSAHLDAAVLSPHWGLALSGMEPTCSFFSLGVLECICITHSCHAQHCSLGTAAFLPPPLGGSSPCGLNQHVFDFKIVPKEAR